MICNRHAAEQVLFGRGASSAGPKPGRNGFSVKLASGRPEYVLSHTVALRASAIEETHVKMRLRLGDNEVRD